MNTIDRIATSSSRRQWLQAIIRWSALGGLAAISAVLVSRNRQGCARLAPCNQCRLSSTCRLPLAVANRAREDS